MRTILRMLVLVALVTMGAWAPAGPVHAQTDTAETPTDTADTDDTTDTDDTDDEDAGDDEGATASTTQRGSDDDLPTTGAPVWLYAAAGAGLLHIGGGMLLAERRVRPDAYWEDHRA